MDFNTAKEEEFGFSGNYFLAKEMGSSGKKAARKLSDINVVDEHVFFLIESPSRKITYCVYVLLLFICGCGFVWDKKMVHAQFNWYWYHVPTFAPYKVEGLFLPLILAHGSSKQSAKTILIVLQSLTPYGQSVFRILAEYQLSHPNDEGMAIDNLYSISRERFLVSSQVTLNSHLTEFKDHELVKTKRHSNGQDCLYIPLTKDGLKN
ncbi:hypothetical protein GOBAR_DD00116 [Gossypium barbadense]|nr:hypothetical protein GOBAR_DD00116 [Gossypium barbadense]